MQRSLGKYQRTYKEPEYCWQISGKNISEKRTAETRRECDARKLCDAQNVSCGDLWENIRSRANICGPISVEVQRSFGKYQQTCEDLLRANISKHAKIFRQISEDVRRLVGKYQQKCEDLFANISRVVEIYSGQISEDVQRSVGKYQ